MAHSYRRWGRLRPLEPYIDAETMDSITTSITKLRYNLNKALEPYPELAELTVEDLASPRPGAETIRPRPHNGGGHGNHQFFWDILGPRGTERRRARSRRHHEGLRLIRAISVLSSPTRHKTLRAGWAFLVVNPPRHRLEIVSLPNQDASWCTGRRASSARCLGARLLLPEVQERRPDYLSAWWKVIAWDVVDERLREVMASS